MNKVIKVSIGNIAFTLEEEAFSVLNSYLDSLNAHYNNHPNGIEIVDGIEERIAELLLEKGNGNRIVTKSMVDDVVNTLGEPETIFNESGYNNQEHSQEKKFYRDPTNKVLGGVCSGLGNYFNREPSMFRVLFIVVAFFFGAPSWGIGGCVIVLIYMCLWLCFPAAKTVEQRCRMRGESNSIGSIEKNIENGAKEIEAKIKEFKIGQIITKCFGFIFTIAGLVGLTSMIVLLFGLNVSTALPIFSIDSLLMFFGGTFAHSLTLKILLAIVLLIPFVLFLFGGIQMLFGFKTPRWRPGLILFLLWIAAGIGIAAIGITSTKGFWNIEERNESFPLALESDTLIIRLDGIEAMKEKKVWIEADRNEYNLVYIDGSDRKSPEIIQYPFIRLRKREVTDPKITLITHYFLDRMTFDEVKNINGNNFYSFDGKNLTLYPVIYSKDNSLTELGREIRLNINEGTTIIIDEPIHHTFTNHFEYSNIGLLKVFD